jgi:cytochrome c oxidase subunit 4
MSTVDHTERHDEGAGHTEHAEHEHTHPSDFQYVMIAVFLAVVTGAEVGLYYIEGIDFLVLSTILLVMMVVKFATVAAFFMHLRFDTKLFRWVFITGLLLATFVYVILLSSFHVFIH